MCGIPKDKRILPVNKKSPHVAGFCNWVPLLSPIVFDIACIFQKMKVLFTLFSLLSFVNGVIAYLPVRFSNRKAQINERFLNLCIKLQKLGDDELAIAIRPLVLWVAGVIFIIATLLI